MTASRTNSKHWIAPGLALVALTGLALIADHRPAPVLINESASLPRGVYVRLPGAAPARDTVVAVPQPSAVRAYLERLGMPDDLLLIKRGAPLPTWRGCRRLNEEELFLLGDTPSSFDSRYFGPVARSRVTGVYREILTW